MWFQENQSVGYLRKSVGYAATWTHGFQPELVM